MERDPRDYIKHKCRHCGVTDGHDDACLLGENERLRAAVEEFLAFEDDHAEGPVVDDSYVKGPICADEDCGRYWPCPVEELRRATR